MYLNKPININLAIKAADIENLSISSDQLESTELIQQSGIKICANGNDILFSLF